MKCKLTVRKALLLSAVRIKLKRRKGRCSANGIGDEFEGIVDLIGWKNGFMTLMNKHRRWEDARLPRR